MAKITITKRQAADAIAALKNVSEDGYVSAAAADDVLFRHPAYVRLVVACDADGGLKAEEAWDSPVALSELEDALNSAASTGYELPE